MTTPAFDHIALNVPDLDAQIERFTEELGMVVESRFGDFAVLSDPGTGVKFELGRSADSEVHVRHFGFRADDVDAAHTALVDAGMGSKEAPHRRDFARMYTSYLEQSGGVEVQLVKYDE